MRTKEGTWNPAVGIITSFFIKTLTQEQSKTNLLQLDCYKRVLHASLPDNPYHIKPAHLIKHSITLQK